MSKPWNLNWKASSDAEAATKITASIILALLTYVWHLAGWTITVHYKGNVIFKIPELW